jgi:hypothetical protein
MRCCAHSAPDGRIGRAGRRRARSRRCAWASAAQARVAHNVEAVFDQMRTHAALLRDVYSPRPLTLPPQLCVRMHCRGRQRGSRSRRGWCGTARGVHSACAALHCTALHCTALRARDDRTRRPCGGMYAAQVRGRAPDRRRARKQHRRRACDLRGAARGAPAVLRTAAQQPLSGLPLARVLTAYSALEGPRAAAALAGEALSSGTTRLCAISKSRCRHGTAPPPSCPAALLSRQSW